MMFFRSDVCAPSPSADAAARCDGKDKLTFVQAQKIANRMTFKGRLTSPYKCAICQHCHVGGRSLKRRPK